MVSVIRFLAITHYPQTTATMCRGGTELQHAASVQLASQSLSEVWQNRKAAQRHTTAKQHITTAIDAATVWPPPPPTGDRAGNVAQTHRRSRSLSENQKTERALKRPDGKHKRATSPGRKFFPLGAQPTNTSAVNSPQVHPPSEPQVFDELD